MSMPQVVHPWSQSAAPVLAALPAVVAPSEASVAKALFGAGFVSAAIAAAESSDDPELSAQADAWRTTQAADGALASSIRDFGGALVPSVSTRDDGAPQFLLRIPDVDAAVDALTLEHGTHGAAAELRLFLAEVLRDGDRFVDAAPGVGFAAMSAATGAAMTSVIVLCADDAHCTAIDMSARYSGAEENVTARANTTLGEIPLAPSIVGATTIVHAGSAADVAPMLSTVQSAVERREIGAVAWRCGRADETGRDAESLQIAAAVLGVLGFQHFALADGSDGPELVPADAMATNEMIFSLSPSLLARFAA